MKNVNIALILLSIILTCSAGAVVVQAQNYTVIMNYGQTPYQLGYLSQGNVTGWTWWDTDGGMQQKNLILVSIMDNTTPVSGLSPPSWIQDSTENYSGSYSWKAGEGIHSWHYLDDYNTSGTPLKDIVLSESQSLGFFAATYNWLNELITGVNPAAAGPMIDLKYRTKYNMTENYGFVKVSVDRGENWETLEKYSGNSSGWVENTVNLTKYNGQQILIAFYFSVNNNNDEEWWIDDIKVISDGKEIFSDGAENPPPVLTANVTYPHYNYSSDNFSSKTSTIGFVEDYVHQIYYGVFNYPDDAYTGEYKVDFSTTINSENLQASTSFSTTLWGCQARGCHDSWSPASDPSKRNPTVMIHPDKITSEISGNCLTVCHSTYSSQYLRASPIHLHDLKYGHRGGFIYGSSGWTTIYNSTNTNVQMYHKSSVKRPLSQTTFDDESHVTEANCVDCHTNFVHDGSGSDTYDIATPYSLSGTTYQYPRGVHYSVSCEACHGIYSKIVGKGLNYPSFDNTKQLIDSIGDYGPEFMSYEALTKTYIIDVDSPDISVTVSGDDNGYGIFLSLIGPIDDASGLQDLSTADQWDGTYCVPSVNGTATFETESKIYFPSGDKLYGVTFDSSPRSGIWIARIFPRSTGTFNYTITSSHPIQQKPVIHIPWNCSECHNPNASGSLAGANTLKPMPSWDNQGLSYTHTDYNSDGEDDITCRFCHNSFHNISITNCTFCHIQRPGGHTQADFYDMGYTGCTFCHKDPHFEPEVATGGNCTDCHLEGGANVSADLPIISRNGFFNSSHSNITGDFNANNYFDISRVCWGCHVNYTEELINPLHTRHASELPDCEDCHFSETPLNGEHLRKIPPVQIPEHQPLGVDIKTNISTNCTFCHNNSLSIPIPTTNVKYAEAKNYVSHYVDTSNLMTPANNTTDCWWCHVDNSNNVSWGKPANPFTSTHYNHTPLNLNDSIDCYPCHISNRVMDNVNPKAGFTFHNDSMVPGAGKDCVSCHDLDGMVREEYQIDVQAMNRSGAIHYDLNRGAANTLDPNNVRCWACHGDGNGSESAQPTGHPVNYNTPENCGNRECHNFNQSIFNEPMVYEHIRYVEDPDEHVNTTADCPACHKNSIVSNWDNFIPNDTSLVSHYGSTWNLANTSDCIYCHLDEDNAEEWGNAPDPRNHTHYTFVEKTIIAGRPWKLMDNYSITLIETSSNAAMFIFERDGKLLERDILSLGDELNFEISGIEDENTSIVTFKINEIFKGINSYSYLVELSGDVLASRIHRETNNVACYACHDREYRTNAPDGRDYYILKKDDENVTLGLIYVNFESRDKKVLRMGEHWELGEGYNLYVEDINLQSNAARLQLYRNETLVEDTIIKEGSNFIYEGRVLDRDINVFNAKLDIVFVGNTIKAIILKDVWLIAGEQKVLDGDLWILQNKKLLRDLPLDSVITVGEEPETFHVYTLSPGKYSSDCISCHAGNGVAPIKIDVDIFKEGVHAYLNQNATCNTFITDEANKACWACHGDGSEPDEHPTPYLGERPPKPCISCHVYSQFDATPVFTHYQGAEISTNSTCWDCHSNSIIIETSNNVEAATSHYSTHENLLYTQSCDVCHNNVTNAPIWGDAPQVTKHNADNDCTLCHAGKGVSTFHDNGITITRNCEACHVDKQRANELNLSAIITHYPGAPEDRVNTLKRNQYTCRVCHNATNETLHTNLEIREYQNETMGYCFPCHSVEGEFPYKSEVMIGALRHGSGINVISGCDACHSPEGISKFHSPTLLGKGTFRGAVRHDIDCQDCHPKHEGKEYQPFKGIMCVDCHAEYGTVHYAGAEVKMANQTTTCVLCHNVEADLYHNLTYFVSDITDEVLEPCRDCHKDIKSLMEHVRSLKIIGGTMATISHTVSENTITCDSCHNVTGENRFHFDSYPMGTVQNPGWLNWTAGNVTKCKDCHTYNGGDVPFYATNMGTQGLSPSGTAHGFAPNCTLCHGGADPISFHTLATTQFVPRLAITLNPEEVFQGETSLLQASVVLPPLTKVTGAEYFIDEMGMEGYGMPLEFIVGGSTDSSVLLGTVIETSDLSLGKHLIFIHVKDSSGKWSNVDIGVLIVKKPIGHAIIETLLRDIVPVLIFIAFLFLIWRRLR
jgi:hypothetical protein